MLGAFTFEEGGRKYACAPETRAAPLEGTWWWFDVANDSNRYAAFEASPGDTHRSVRERIVAWYERRLWVRSQPPTHPERPGRPGRPAMDQSKSAAPSAPNAPNKK